MKQELLVYGLKKGEPKYMEELLAENIYNLDDVEKIKNAAKQNGYVTFRVVPFTLSIPDFIKSINS